MACRSSPSPTPPAGWRSWAGPPGDRRACPTCAPPTPRSPACARTFAWATSGPAWRRGFASAELVKRRTGAMTGPCQGKLCAAAVLAACATWASTRRRRGAPAEPAGHAGRSPPMRSVVVVGAGIAGLVLAVELRRRGCAVTVVEARYPAPATRSRNIGRDPADAADAGPDRVRLPRGRPLARLDRLAGGRNPLLYPTRYVWALYEDASARSSSRSQPMWSELGARGRRRRAARARRRAGAPRRRGAGRRRRRRGRARPPRRRAPRLPPARPRARRRRDRDGDGAGHPRRRAVEQATDSGETSAGEVVVNTAGGRAGEVARAFGIEAVNSPIRREVLVRSRAARS